MKVLFVDDNLAGMKAHTSQLKRLGWEVIATDRVDRAWQVFRECEGTWDLVIVDLSMPPGECTPKAELEEVGYELLLLMRRRRETMPAVVLTNVEAHPVLRRIDGLPHVKTFRKREQYAKEFAVLVSEFLHDISSGQRWP